MWKNYFANYQSLTYGSCLDKGEKTYDNLLIILLNLQVNIGQDIDFYYSLYYIKYKANDRIKHTTYKIRKGEFKC